MRVGADIQSTCRKCGDVWHLVIAMSNGQIAKVECKDCGARHGYRPIAGTVKPKRRVSTIPTRRAASKRAPGIVEGDLSRPRRSFQTTDAYEVGDRIIHPSFGEGVVQQLVGPTKVEVLFETGLKTMVHGRSAS
jgi:hypothetical protein